MWKADSLEKTLMLGKIEGRKRRGKQDEMVGWHHWLNGHEFEQALGDSEGQRSLACCSPWGQKESDTTEKLNSEQQWFLKDMYSLTLPVAKLKSWELHIPPIFCIFRFSSFSSMVTSLFLAILFSFQKAI